MANENDDNYNLLNTINEVEHNYSMPILCPNHKNIQFNSLSSYLIHCKEAHKIFTCKDCGEVFQDFKNFKLHIGFPIKLFPALVVPLFEKHFMEIIEKGKRIMEAKLNF